MSLQLDYLKQRPMSRHGPALFAVIRNEIFQLPHFLEHYRRLGIADFLIYDDSSTDGSRELLLAQPDVAVITSAIPFGRKIAGNMRWVTVIKSVLPAQLFETKWVAVADADEYLVLPEAFADVPAFAGWLERRGERLVSAALVDCYPATLAGRSGRPSAGPSELCPFFDRGPLFLWKSGQLAPRALRAGVRARLFAMLGERFPEQSAGLIGPQGPNLAKLWKVPLIRSGSGVMIVSQHEANVPPPRDFQVAILHYKFTPDLDAKIAHALQSRAYYNDSQEYRFLDLAVRLLADEPLVCAHTVERPSPQTLEAAGLLFFPGSRASAGGQGVSN